MRKHIRLLLVAVMLCFEVGWVAPIQAQGFGQGEADVVVTPEMRKKRDRRRILGLFILSPVLVVAGIFLVLNALDRRAAKRALLEKQLERHQQGLL